MAQLSCFQALEHLLTVMKDLVQVSLLGRRDLLHTIKQCFLTKDCLLHQRNATCTVQFFGLLSRDKSNEHSFQQKRAGIIERNENRVRIIDFGVSYNSNNTFDSLSLFINSESSIYGTPMSMPPEVYNSTIITTAKATLWKRHGRKAAASFNFGMARDIWSLGVLL